MIYVKIPHVYSNLLITVSLSTFSKRAICRFVILSQDRIYIFSPQFFLVFLYYFSWFTSKFFTINVVFAKFIKDTFVIFDCLNIFFIPPHKIFDIFKKIEEGLEISQLIKIMIIFIKSSINSSSLSFFSFEKTFDRSFKN